MKWFKSWTERPPCTHHWGNWKVYNEGIQLRVCTICGWCQRAEVEHYEIQ